MSIRWLLIPALLVLTPGVRAEDKKEPELFGRDRIWTLHLILTDKEWDAMQPSGRMAFPGFPGAPAPKPEDKKDEKKDAKTSVFGLTFPYVKGSIEFEGKTWKNVGVRFKGNSTYLGSSRGLKRPLKLDFNHYDNDQSFLGHSTLNLNNDIMDTAHVRQTIGFALFHDAGVPAPRTAFVQLYLTVTGKRDKEYVGLYTLVEEVNKAFLRRHFDTSKGLLLKPERIQGLPHLGDDWKAYTNYQAKTKVRPEDAKRLIAFTRLLDKADDETFKKELPNYLEVDNFLRYLAVNVLTANLDSFIGVGHNYYLYVHPKTGKISWIPWDLDLGFGGLPMIAGEQDKLSIREPHVGKNRLVERVLAIKEYDKAYRDHLRKLTETAFSKKKIHEDIDALSKALAKVVAKEPRPMGGGFPFMGQPRGTDLKPFVEKRLESVVAQLDGKSEGIKPAFNFGGGPGIGLPNVRPFLELVDGNKDGKVSEQELTDNLKKLFKDADRNKDGVLDERELADLMQKLTPRPRPFGGGPGGPGPMPGGPGGRPRPEQP